MRYEALLSFVFVAVSAAPALALPVDISAREFDVELYDRDVSEDAELLARAEDENLALLARSQYDVRDTEELNELLSRAMDELDMRSFVHDQNQKQGGHSIIRLGTPLSSHNRFGSQRPAYQDPGLRRPSRQGVHRLPSLKIARADSQPASGGQHHGGLGAGQSHEGHHGGQQRAGGHHPATPPSYDRSGSPRPQQQFPGSTHPAHRGEHNRPHPMNERRTERAQSGGQHHGGHHSSQQGGQQGEHRSEIPPPSSYHHLGSPLLQLQHPGSTRPAHLGEYKHPVNERRAEHIHPGGEQGRQQGGQHQGGQHIATPSYHGGQQGGQRPATRPSYDRYGSLRPAHQGGHDRTPSLKERSSVWDWEMDLD